MDTKNPTRASADSIVRSTRHDAVVFALVRRRGGDPTKTRDLLNYRTLPRPEPERQLA